MENDNDKYKEPKSSNNIVGQLIGLGLAAMAGAVSMKVYDIITEKKPEIKKRPEKLFVGKAFIEMTEEEQQYVFDHIDDEFKCNLSLGIMTNPVILECGHTFERDILESTLKSQASCPYCREVLANPKGIPNISLRNAIENQVDKLRTEYMNLQKKANELLVVP